MVIPSAATFCYVQVIEVMNTIKERLLAFLNRHPTRGIVVRDLVFDACEHITSLEHENQKMRECIDGIISAYGFMTSFGESEGFLQDGFKNRLIDASTLISGDNIAALKNGAM